MGWQYINTTIYIVNTVCVQFYSGNVDPRVSCPSAKVSWDMDLKKKKSTVQFCLKKKHSWSKPSAVQQAFPEALREGLNPVMSQHHSLRHTQVELLLWVQNHSVALGYSEQLLQQLYEFVLRMVWWWWRGTKTQQFPISAYPAVRRPGVGERSVLRGR